VNTHPKLQIYELKRRIVQIERRWAAEQLRPRLQVDYAFLRDPTQWQVGWSRPFETNYKLTVTFAMPLYLRQARGQLTEARLRLLQLESEQLYEARSLYTKSLGQLTLIDSLYQQLKEQETIVQGLFALVALENERFRAGESDLFVINRREREAFSALISLYDLYARYGLAVAEFGAIVAWVP
jgi:outer membrane protein TolC